MSKPATRTELDARRCPTADDHPILMIQRCHPTAGVRARLFIDGLLEIRCYRCDEMVEVVQIDPTYMVSKINADEEVTRGALKFHCDDPNCKDAHCVGLYAGCHVMDPVLIYYYSGDLGIMCKTCQVGMAWCLRVAAVASTDHVNPLLRKN